MKTKLQVLILEDSPTDVKLARRELNKVLKNPVFRVVSTEMAYTKALDTFKPDLIISDYQLQSFNGLAALEIRQVKAPFTPFILLTGSVNEETAVNVMKAGADDYILKEHMRRLGPAILGAIKKKKLELNLSLDREALHRSEELFKKAFITSPDAININRLEDGMYVQINQGFSNIMGYSQAEVIGKTSLELNIWVNPADRNRLVAGLRKRGEVKNLEAEFRKKNGDIAVGLISAVLIDLNGTPHILSITRDTTERKQEQELLRTSEELNKSITQTATDAIITIDSAGTIRSWNRGAEKIFGYKASEMLGQPLKKIIPPGYWSAHTAAIKRLQRGEKAKLMGQVIELKALRKQGDEFPVELTLSSWKQAEKINYTGILRDITERVKSRKLLQQSEEHHRSIFNNNHLPMLIIDPVTATIVDANPAAAHFYGWSREELLSKKISEINTLPVSDVYHEMNNAKTKQRTYFHFKHRLANGNIRDVEVFSGPINIAGKELLYSTVIDVTERTKIERAFYLEKQRVENILEGINAGTWDWNIQTGELIINSRWAEIIGYTLDELAPIDINTWSNNVHPEDLPIAQAALEKHFCRESNYYNVVFRQPHKNGSWVWVNALGKVIEWSDDDKPLRMSGTHLDITERKQAEAERLSLETQLRQAQKLEALGTMASGIAHDFNNILQGVYLYSGIIKDQLPDDAELRSNFQHIIDSAERAKELVRQILTFSRKEEAALKPVKLQYLLKEAIKLTRAATPSTIQITESIDVECASVMCDATQFHQVFVNLTNNAVHAMRETGGTLFVSLRQIESPIKVDHGNLVMPEKGTVEMIVSDTGHGMDAETLDKIFDPFFTTKEVGEGTGLGLSIVHGIVNDMHGEIKVSSKPGKGTTFRILMPVGGDQAQPNVVREKLKKPVQGLRILFVDDDEMISGAGKIILEREGNQVTVVDNGDTALEYFRKDPEAYDLIITDLTMPGMTGVELGKAIRELSKKVTLILTSGNLDLKLKSDYDSIGFNGFVRKPWTAPEMVTMINSLYSK